MTHLLLASDRLLSRVSGGHGERGERQVRSGAATEVDKSVEAGISSWTPFLSLSWLRQESRPVGPGHLVTRGWIGRGRHKDDKEETKNMAGAVDGQVRLRACAPCLACADGTPEEMSEQEARRGRGAFCCSLLLRRRRIVRILRRKEVGSVQPPRESRPGAALRFILAPISSKSRLCISRVNLHLLCSASSLFPARLRFPLGELSLNTPRPADCAWRASRGRWIHALLAPAPPNMHMG